MKIFKKAILPFGYTASGIACGLKKSGKPDLALFCSSLPAKAQGVFTTNTFAAAPVIVCKKHLKAARTFRAIITNSGNANCFTGKKGLQDAWKMCQHVAAALGVDSHSVLVGSTGIIGRSLAIEKIKAGIPGLVKALSKAGIAKAKQAIMTTDRFSKELSVRFFIGERKITLCGVAKGAGMIAPDMATMLAYIFTDAQITRAALTQALKEAVEGSFNRITVDGCMSTNDTVIVMANGAARNRLIASGKDLAAFKQALAVVCLHLAKEMVRDGEGATKLIQINVSGAASPTEAKKAALAIANSNLFKTAMYGENPNFGRIVGALGATGIAIKQEKLKIKLGSLSKKEITIAVGLGRGSGRATVYTSDLSPGYIRINAAYN